MNKIINASVDFLRRNSPTILTCIGAAGVVGTAIMAAKATPKAMYLIEEAKEEKGSELTTLETVVAAAPAYMPTIVTGAATIACIVGANALNKQQQASLISAYALLDQSYTEYRNKVKDIYGEDADHTIKKEILKDKQDELIPDDLGENQLFFDFNTMQYFEAPFNQVIEKATMNDGLECYIISTPYI